MNDATALVSERVDKLLADVDPKAVDDATFRGRQYDLGLAWVHFPEGYGGLGLPPAATIVGPLSLQTPPTPAPATSSVSPWPDRRS